MEEFKRILTNKKVITGFILLLAVNLFITYNSIKMDSEAAAYYEENYDGNFEKDLYEKHNELIKKYQKMDLNEAFSEVQGITGEYWKKLEEEAMEELSSEASDKLTEEDIYYKAIFMVNENLTYLVNFENELDEIDKRAENMKNSTILYEEGSFSKRNIEKTRGDYDSLKNTELSLDNEQSLSSYIKEDYTGFLLIAAGLILILTFLEERKKGMWQLIYSMKNGRERMVVLRGIILSAALFICGIFLEVSRIILICMHYGGMDSLGNLSRMVQSNPDFSGCMLKVSVAGFLCISILIKILTAVFVTMVIWIFTLVIENVMVSYAGILMIVFGEYGLYLNIDRSSRLNALKYINIFTGLNCEKWLVSYQNINIFGYPFGVRYVCLVLLPVMFFIACLALYFAGARRPFTVKQTIISKVFRKLEGIVRPYRHGSLFLHEGYKIFMRQHVLWILIASVIFCIYKTKPEKIFYSYELTIYNQYMEQLEGAYSEEKDAYLERELSLWNEKYKESEKKLSEYEAAMEAEKSSDLYRDEYEREQSKLENYQTAIDKTSELITLGERLKGKTSEGYAAGFVNETGYNMLIGENGKGDADMDALIILVILTVSLAGVYSYEKSQNSVLFIRSMEGGRKKINAGKLVLTEIIVVIVVSIVSFSRYIYVKETYGLSQASLWMGSLPMFENTGLKLNIGQLMLALFMLRILGATVAALIILFISSKMRNMQSSLIVSFMIVVIPAALVVINVKGAEYVSLSRLVSVTGWL